MIDVTPDTLPPPDEGPSYVPTGPPDTLTPPVEDSSQVPDVDEGDQRGRPRRTIIPRGCGTRQRRTYF